MLKLTLSRLLILLRRFQRFLPDAVPPATCRMERLSWREEELEYTIVFNRGLARRFLVDAGGFSEVWLIVMCRALSVKISCQVS